MNDEKFGFDTMADQVFSPVYPVYARMMIERTKKRSGRLADLGAGGGHLGFAVMDIGDFESVTFIDKNSDALDTVKMRAEARGYEKESSFVLSDAMDIDVPDNSFDLVVSRGSLPFWEDKAKGIREVYRILKEDGCAYLGGGIGGDMRQTKRIERLMELRLGAEKAHNRPCRSMANFSLHDWVDLFEEIGCSWSIIHSEGEGNWYVFRKKSN